MIEERDFIKQEEVKKDFYRIRTKDKTYFCDTLDEIVDVVGEEKGGFEVAHIEYIGNFKGKEDVLLISTPKGEEYVTFVTSDIVTFYVPYYHVWKCQNNTSYEMYYEILKQYGVKLRNDVYLFDKYFRDEVNRQLDSINQ